MLVGNQPVGRVLKPNHPVRAEDPFYEDDLYAYSYPESVEKRLRPGWRAAIVTVPAKEAMVQVNDYVDLYCTMTSDAFGPGGNAEAKVARGAKVVARFGTTRPGAQPAKLDAPREYTLEVTPRRYALIELAKGLGAKFSLAVTPQVVEGDRSLPPPGNDLNDPEEQRGAELVTVRDLESLFGISPPETGPGPWEVEKYAGIKNEGKTTYPGYVPPSRTAATQAPPAQVTPAAGQSAPQKATPAGFAPGGGKSVPVSSKPAAPAAPAAAASSGRKVTTQTTSFNPSTSVASTSRNFGLRAPRELVYRAYNAKTDCST
jgi:hypothetical protein